MESLPIKVFEGSYGPILSLLNENRLKYSMRGQWSGVVVASSTVIDVVLNATIWASIATVLVTFIKARSGRKIIITTKDNRVIHAEGLTSKELEEVLKFVKDVMAIDPNPSDENSK